MTKFVLKSFSNAYLLESTISANKHCYSTLNQCNLKNYYINRMLHTFPNTSSKKLLGTESRSLRKLQLVKGIPKFYSNGVKSNGLMDLKVQFRVPYLKKLFTPFQYIRFRMLDSEFNIIDFKESAKYALELVLKCLSNEQYDELKTLLTNECKTEVEQNVKMMSPGKRVELAISTSDILSEDGYLYLDDKDGKTIGEVVMIYLVCKNLKPSIMNLVDHTVPENKGNCVKDLQLYNCTFIKDFTKDSNDQWKINKINFLNLHLQGIKRLF